MSPLEVNRYLCVAHGSPSLARFCDGWVPHLPHAQVEVIDDTYWLSRHWAVPSLYSQDDWYQNEADRLRERAPA